MVSNYTNTIPVWARVYLTVLTILLTILVVRSLAFSEEGSSTCHSAVWTAAQKLQPWYYRSTNDATLSRRSRVLRDITDAVCTIAPAHEVDPLLAVSLAFRESSLLPHVGLGKQDGQLGERGYWQVMPGGKAESFVSDTCSQHSPLCNAQSAFSYLAWLRDDLCQSDDPWVYVGAYGRGRCPGEGEDPRDWPEVKIARRYYCEVNPDCAVSWPE